MWKINSRPCQSCLNVTSVNCLNRACLSVPITQWLFSLITYSSSLSQIVLRCLISSSSLLVSQTPWYCCYACFWVCAMCVQLIHCLAGCGTLIHIGQEYCIFIRRRHWALWSCTDVILRAARHQQLPSKQGDAQCGSVGDALNAWVHTES